jgi:hypothetical protein
LRIPIIIKVFEHPRARAAGTHATSAPKIKNLTVLEIEASNSMWKMCLNILELPKLERLCDFGKLNIMTLWEVLRPIVSTYLHSYN